METLGLHHAAIVVKDMDRAVEFLKKVFKLDFQEIPWAPELFGTRLCFSIPGGQFELFSIIDQDKVDKAPPPFDELAKFARDRGEGIHRLCFQVKDVEETIEDAKKVGVRTSFMLEEKEVGPFKNFKEILFNDEDLPIKGLYSIAFYSPEEITKEHNFIKLS